MLSWSSNFLVVLKLKSRCSFTLESAWTMKLIRSSSLGAADFLSFYTSYSSWILQRPIWCFFLPHQLPPQLPFSFNFVLSFLVWSIDALQPVARAYNMAVSSDVSFAISSEVSFCHLICCLLCWLIWCFIFPSHLMFHFAISSDVSLPVLCRMQRAKWEKKNVTCWFSSRKLVHSREKP